MWPHSARWDATLVRDHTILAYAQLLVDGEVVADTQVDQLRLTAARVAVAEGAVRRTASLSLYDEGGLLVPVVDKRLILPRTCEVRLWSGVRYYDATDADDVAGTATEYVPAFTGPITAYDLVDYPNVNLECSDRMWYVQRPFSEPYTVVDGQPLDDAILSLLQAKVPPTRLQTNLPVTYLQSSLLLYDEQADPADGLRTLGTAAGWTIYADQLGTFQGADEPEVNEDNVVATYEAGSPTEANPTRGALIRPKVSGNVQNMFNVWVVTGEASGDTGGVPWAKVVDDDPNSPTYVSGPYDEHPRFYSSPLLKTDAQCLLAANTLRRREGGLSDAVTVEAFRNAALDKSDVVRVRGGIVDRLILTDSFDLDLLSGKSQEIAARAGGNEAVPLV